MSLDLADLIRDAGVAAHARGWHDRDHPTTFPEQIALVHSELSEALEEFRANREPADARVDATGKPLGIPSELADVVIRVAEMSHRYGIDLVTAIRAKLEYNATRPHRHGGKRL